LAREISKNFMYPTQKLVMLIDEEIDWAYNCKILNAAGNMTEKFLGPGWYEYVQAKKLKVGEQLDFIYDKDANIIIVKKVI
jgi:hypothetical protein